MNSKSYRYDYAAAAAVAVATDDVVNKGFRMIVKK